MQTNEGLICPYVSGSMEGAMCRIENRYVKESDELDIHVCLSEHFEHCPVLRFYNEDDVVV